MSTGLPPSTRTSRPEAGPPDPDRGTRRRRRARDPAGHGGAEGAAVTVVVVGTFLAVRIFHRLGLHPGYAMMTAGILVVLIGVARETGAWRAIDRARTRRRRARRARGEEPPLALPAPRARRVVASDAPHPAPGPAAQRRVAEGWTGWQVALAWVVIATSVIGGVWMVVFLARR